MNSMDLFKAFGDIDESLMFDAIEGGAQPQKSSGAAPVKQPKPGKPQRGGTKTKAIAIGAVAIVLAAVITCLVLYFTGVFGGKQVPIYTGMEISSVNATSSDDDANIISYKYSGDYIGRNDDIDKDKPFGDGSTTIDQAAQSSLQIVSAGDTIYYADAGDDIYVAINFDNPDKYDIVSFSLSDGTNTYDFSGLLGNFEDGSTYEQIIIKLNVGTTGGIIEYSISKIKYLDDNSVNSDVIIGGETVVKCGVRTSDMTSASVTTETTTLTSISITATVTDKYSLIDYSDGYVKAILFDGSTIIHIKDLQLGSNSVVFDSLSPDTLYQYAIVAYYDDFSGGGAALHYLYTDAIYTSAVVLFDTMEIGQESISFTYSWYTGYSSSNLTSLTLTHKGETTSLDTTATSITDLLSNNEYTLTASYTGINGAADSISLTFTTEEKAVPEVEIEVTDETTSTLTFSVDFIDTDGVGEITAIALYNGDTLVQSETNLNQGEYTYSGLDAYTEYTLKVSYSYDLNDGVGTQQAAQTLSEHTVPLVQVQSMSVTNTSAVTEGGTIYITATVNNPSNVTYTSAVVNGVTYTSLTGSKGSTLYIDITNDGQFEGGTTTLTLTQLTCTIGGKTYTIDVTDNNEASVFINGTLTIEGFAFVRLNEGVYEETSYAFPDETLYYKISLGNATKYNINNISIAIAQYTYTFSSSNMTVTDDYQTVYIEVDLDDVCDYIVKLSSISYSNSYGDNKTQSLSGYSTWLFKLASADIVEITTAEQLKDVDDYKYYKLMNDIDLSGYEWANMGNALIGVFDGNGHKIYNMTAKTTYENTDLYLGLFSSVQGVVTNLEVQANYRITLNNTTSTSYFVYIGGITATSENGMSIDNVTVDITAVLTANGNIPFIYAGGLGGRIDRVYATENVTVEDNIYLTINENPSYSMNIGIGGLYGSAAIIEGGKIENANVTLTADVTYTNVNSSNVIAPGIVIGGLNGISYTGSEYNISDVTVNSEVTAAYSSSSLVAYLDLGGVLADGSSLAKLYNVTSTMVVNYGTGISVTNDETYAYTDEDCSLTFTSNYNET